MESEILRLCQKQYTIDEKQFNINNCKKLYSLANDLLLRSQQQGQQQGQLQNIVLACECYNKIVNSVEITEYLLMNYKSQIPKNIYLESLMNLGNYLKVIVENLVNTKITELHKNNATRTNKENLALSSLEQCIFNKSLNCFITFLQVEFEDENAIKQIISIYTQLTYMSQNNHELALKYLLEALSFSPTNPIINYNLGHIYQRINNLEKAMCHYKLSIELNKQSTSEQQIAKRNLDINNYNGIASIYRNIKKWPESLHFLLKAHQIDKCDPDINNQLGVVYTEMRRTDLGENHYKLAIKHYKQTFVSTDPTFLLSEIYLNYGHLHSYNGNNEKSIECYNESLKVVPKFALPFQNKIMNLNYIFDQLPNDNKLYITNQHKQINKLYAKNLNPFKHSKEITPKINIGIISGDFIDHPVSFFISTYLKNFDTTKFNVTCYSECIIDTSLFNTSECLKFKLIKNMSQENASQLIHNDNIHILLDLAGHTAFNRLDIFSFKPAPIQITYIGYPFTTGLNEMDYRITDNICDNNTISQQFYTEKLLYLENCFLCYDPTVITRDPILNKAALQIDYPKILESPYITNTYITIGCYNRINKITDNVIHEFNKIMMTNKNIRFVFKTKALINTDIASIFLNKFNKNVQERITILDCTLSHKQHLETYNKIDIAIDTFPYSGTTTSCESLFMGVPVFSIYDTKYYFHPQNVTCSILKNSNLDFYICNNTDEIIHKINIIEQNPALYINPNKIRTQFLSSKVCNKELYMNNLQQLFTTLYNKFLTNSLH